jgi:hypothetical protein
MPIFILFYTGIEYSKLIVISTEGRYLDFNKFSTLRFLIPTHRDSE